MRTRDWSASPLGPVDGWPPCLRTAVDIMLASPGPVAILWGPDQIQLYNDGYLPLAADRHPRVLGRTAHGNLPENFEAVLRPLYQEVLAGRSVGARRISMPLRRSDEGRLEERTFDASFSPIRDEAGTVLGIYCLLNEVSGRSSAERELRETRKFYEDLFDAIDEGLLFAEAMFDETGRCIDVLYRDESPAAVRLLGRSFKGRLFSEMGDYEPYWFQIFGHVARTGEAQRLERYAQVDGVWYDFFVFKPPRAKANEIAVVFRDDTVRRNTEERLRESEELFRALADVVPQIVWSTHGSGSEFYNRRWYDYTGLDEDSSLRLGGWQAVVHPDDLPSAAEREKRSQADGSTFEVEYRLRRRDGEYRWHIARAERIPGTDRWVGSATDIHDLKLAAEALRGSEERFRSFAEATDDVMWIVDARSRKLEYLSPAYERLWGEPRDKVMADLSRWGDRLHPDDRPPPGEGLEALLAGRYYTAEYRILRHDGSTRYVRDTGFPIFDANGKVRRVAGVAQDLTHRREAERALAESERRARTMLEGLPLLVWRSRDAGQWTWASPQWTGFTGQPESASHGRGWLASLHPDDREVALEAWAEAGGGDGFEVDYRIRSRDGSYRWFHTRATPVRDDAGEVVEWLGTSTDVDELYRLQRHQRVLLAELQHRVRNTLGVVRSIVRRTAETSEDVEDMSAHLQGRLDAFSRVQSAVTRDPGGKVDLATLVEDELLAHATRESTGTRIKGPSVRLEPRIAEGLSLALHELTSNAVKYGALGSDSGRLAVSWKVARVEEGEQLELLWQELGLESPPEEPQRRGFGLELLERQLPYELDATTLAEFLPTGFRFTLQMPLDSAEEDRERLLKRKPTHMI